LKLGQKLGALTGSFVYLLPPIPFLMGIISQKLFRVQAEKQENGKSSVLGRLGHFY